MQPTNFQDGPAAKELVKRESESRVELDYDMLDLESKLLELKQKENDLYIQKQNINGRIFLHDFARSHADVMENEDGGVVSIFKDSHPVIQEQNRLEELEKRGKYLTELFLKFELALDNPTEKRASWWLRSLNGSISMNELSAETKDLLVKDFSGNGVFINLFRKLGIYLKILNDGTNTLHFEFRPETLEIAQDEIYKEVAINSIEYGRSYYQELLELSDSLGVNLVFLSKDGETNNEAIPFDKRVLKLLRNQGKKIKEKQT